MAHFPVTCLVVLAGCVAVAVGGVPNTAFIKENFLLPASNEVRHCGVNNTDHFISGWLRDTAIQNQTSIYGFRCGKVSAPYTRTNVPYQCKNADWRTSITTAHAFNLCPNGHFLYGIDLKKHGLLSDIRFGKCCKPAQTVNYYDRCYFPDVDEKDPAPKCDRGFFLSGFQTKCSTGLQCITKLKCCKMLRVPPVSDSHDDVKTKVMDMTQKDLALMGHYLGFQNAFGCKAQFVGEGFNRDGDSWEADNSFGCSETERLKIRYSEWGFTMKGVPKLGKAIMSDVTPEMLMTGLIVNQDKAPVEHSVSRTVSVTSSVTNTVTAGFSIGFGVSFKIGYEGSFLGQTLGATFNFAMDIDMEFQYSQSKTKSSTEEVTQTISKTVPANTAMRYRVLMSRTRATVPYCALLKLKFKVEFQGKLKADHHFNIKHIGADASNVRSGFGSQDFPFYEDVDLQQDYGMMPWDWIRIKGKYPHFRTVMESLKQEAWYLYPIHGKFDNIAGSHTYVVWQEFPADSETAQTTNPLQTTPDPPEVPKKDPEITFHSYTPVYETAPNQ